MRRLLLLRHAKTEAEHAAGDHARVLAPRGLKDAPAMAAAMKAKGYLPDFVLCSTAARTVQTFELAAPLLGDPPVEFDDRLYLASWKSIVALAREAKSTVKTLLVVGHNPGLEDCAQSLLTRDPGDQALRESLEEKFPTGALAVIDCPIKQWRELKPASCTLADFLTPKTV